MLRWGILLALVVLALDQATKFLIVALIDQSYAGNLDIREITPFFNIWQFEILASRSRWAILTTVAATSSVSLLLSLRAF